MAPIEDMQSRDLAWISDFVMQQMVIMLRPMMDHLQQTDCTADYTQRAVQRLSMDVTEIRGDIERTNKYLSILRQGLGVQNEGKCMLQRGLEGNTRTLKRLDEQMDNMLGVIRGFEDSFAQLCSDFRGSSSKHEELSNRVLENYSAFEDLQAKVEKISSETHTVKDDLLSSEARLEVWQRELRELRRAQLSMAPNLKLEEKASKAPPSSQSVRGTDWPQKKSFSTMEVSEKSGGNTPGTYAGTSNFGDLPNNPGSSQQPRKISRVDSSSSRATLLPSEKTLQQEHLSFGANGRSASRVWSPGEEADGPKSGEEVSENSRLPLLAARQPVSMARNVDRTAVSEGPRLRFTATMAKPPSQGSPS